MVLTWGQFTGGTSRLHVKQEDGERKRGGEKREKCVRCRATIRRSTSQRICVCRTPLRRRQVFVINSSLVFILVKPTGRLDVAGEDDI